MEGPVESGAPYKADIRIDSNIRSVSGIARRDQHELPGQNFRYRNRIPS
jgi:hypothetical protein